MMRMTNERPRVDGGRIGWDMIGLFDLRFDGLAEGRFLMAHAENRCVVHRRSGNVGGVRVPDPHLGFLRLPRRDGLQRHRDAHTAQ
jgi:hypothetical protein